MDVIQSAERFNSYLIVDKNELIIAGYTVNNMLINEASTDEILQYLIDQTDRMANTLAKSFTGLYGWVDNTYLDSAGWVPDDDFVATERPWYKAAVSHPHEGHVPCTIKKETTGSMIGMDIFILNMERFLRQEVSFLCAILRYCIRLDDIQFFNAEQLVQLAAC